MRNKTIPDYKVLYQEAAAKLECTESELMMYSWHTLFSSTAGPHTGRVGGQALTLFQVIAFSTEYMDTGIMYCDGIWKEWDGHTTGGWK